MHIRSLFLSNRPAHMDAHKYAQTLLYIPSLELLLEIRIMLSLPISSFPVLSLNNPSEHLFFFISILIWQYCVSCLGPHLAKFLDIS